jgi:hypothetical protein
MSQAKLNFVLTKKLPILYATDSKGKLRVWKCWVIEDTVYREYGLVDGKKINSERVFEGKNVGKKNETSASEQAWNEANREWVSHIDKKYEPADDDKVGLKMMKTLNLEKEKSGGHNINSVHSTGGGTTKKNISREKKDTFMIETTDSVLVIPMKAECWELSDESDPHSVLPKVSKYFTKSLGKNKGVESVEFYGQPKLDGWRCRVAIKKIDDEWKVIMTSNSGKQYPWFESLRALFIEWLSNEKIDLSLILDGLDGELYSQDFKDEDGKNLDPLTRFSTVCSICALARSKPHELEDQIQFHCFDLVDVSGTLSQKERFSNLDKLFKRIPKKVSTRVIRVETEIIDDIKKVPKVHDKYEKLGYEGIVLRTFDMKYKAGKRTAEMRKFKYFKDEEYKIVGSKLDKGVSKEHFVWVLETPDGKEFSAKPMGTQEQKFEWYDNKSKYIGLMLTVKFQEFTEDGIPRFPIAKHFRSAKGFD